MKRLFAIGIIMIVCLNYIVFAYQEDEKNIEISLNKHEYMLEDPDLSNIQRYMDNVITTNYEFFQPTQTLLNEEEPLNELEQIIDAKRRMSVPKNKYLPQTITENNLGETNIISYQMDDCKKVYNVNDNFFNQLKSGTQINDLLMENNCIWLITVTNGLNGKAYACMQKDDDSKELRPVNLIIEVEGKDYLLSNKRINEILSEMNIPDEKNIVYVKVVKDAARTTIACITTEDNTGYYMPVQDNCGFMYTPQGKLEQGKVYSLDEICRYFE